MARWVQWLEEIGSGDVARFGGKNASVGELIGHLAVAGVRVPPGFATSAEAYRRFVAANRLEPTIDRCLGAFEHGEMGLAETGQTIRDAIVEAPWPEELEQAICAAYRELGRRRGDAEPTVAVRSSATAEDLPEASFAGQLESFLDVRGEAALLEACRRCFASLFTDRAITYRREKGFRQPDLALSVGVQAMVRSDRGASGVLFTLDTESGFPRVVRIDAAWGLGESVVQGAVDPDSYLVFKPLLGNPALVPILDQRRGAKQTKVVYAQSGGTRTVSTSAAERGAWVLDDAAILDLARQGAAIEAHYGRPMDVEWARDGASGELFVVQARPETVQSRRGTTFLETYTLTGKGRLLATGLAIGEAIATGTVCRLASAAEIDRFRPGAILVTGKTDPDWVPIMRRAAGIVTDHGGRTSHAAIVARELGIPAIVGTGNATQVLEEDAEITLCCAEGEEGHVYAGSLPFEHHALELENLPRTETRLMINLASPAAALRWWRLPCHGIGLLRMEYIVSQVIKVHPMALACFDQLPPGPEKERIAAATAGWPDKAEYFVDHLAWGIGTIAATQYPEPVILRLSDFKTNEYAALLGGARFEPHEDNPMLGWRGASRYYGEGYAEGFALECAAVRRVRERMGLVNVKVMIPFCRTPEEADAVLAALAKNGLSRGENGLEVWVMCEVPSNVVLAEEFARRFDGFSIGSNDLTQLLLGVDRDCARLAPLFDERHEAVLRTIADVISRAHACGRPVGICGQAPSDHPEFAAFLVAAGIDSISLAPDSLLPTLRRVAAAEEHRMALAH